MRDRNERIRQQIAMELENARLCGIFLLPAMSLFITLIFTDFYFGKLPIVRYTSAMGVLVFVFFLIILRIEIFRRIRKYIDQL